MLDYSEKTRDVVLGLFLVGSDKEFEHDNFKKVMNANKDFKSYDKNLDNMIYKYTDNDTNRQFETVTAFICDNMVEACKDRNPKMFQQFVDIAKKELARDYKGAGDELAEILAYAIIFIRGQLWEVFKEDNVYGVSLVVKVPKYVTVLLESSAKKHGGVEWVMTHDPLISDIHSTMEYEAKTNGVNGYLINFVRWTDI